MMYMHGITLGDSCSIHSRKMPLPDSRQHIHALTLGYDILPVLGKVTCLSMIYDSADMPSHQQMTL
eukprot:c14846_g1_i1 orf=777-974(+)